MSKVWAQVFCRVHFPGGKITEFPYQPVGQGQHGEELKYILLTGEEIQR